jgi:uncharacterized protein YkwD
LENDMKRRLGILVFAVTIAACNMVTGAGDLGVGDDDDDGDGGAASGGAGSGSGSGSGNGTGSPSSGPSGSGGSGAASSAASGGGDTSSGAGGAPTTTSGAGGSVTTSGGGGMCAGGAGPATTPLDSEEQAFLVLINNYRAMNGLGALAHCISLDRAAQGHSEDMRDQDYFDHTGLDGSSPWDRSCEACFDLGCGPSTAMAENIAAGNSGAAATFDQWKNSPGHNANMLNGSFTMLGIGRATGGGMYGVYWTNVFAGNDEASCY